MEENEKIIQNIQKSMEVEGCNITEADVSLMSSFLRNEITEKEGIEKIKSEFLNFGDINV